eukprot:m.135612 g.135612  ORF g.135612 m.135612 type:complete len:660 (-) comp15997_c1_seq4:92-2071(-)
MAQDIQTVAAQWEKVELGKLQQDLDHDALQLEARKNESEERRKALVAKVKTFRGALAEDVRKQLAPMMKLFQTEIDALTKRSRASETAFLRTYQQMVNLSDPAPWLKAAISKDSQLGAVEELKLENQKLRSTISDYRSEFSDLKNQEVTIKNLQDQIDAQRTQQVQMVDTKVAEREAQLRRELAATEKSLQEERLALATKLGTAEQESSTLQQAMDALQSEMYDVRQKFEADLQAKAQEADMVVADLHRANDTIESLKRELELEQQRSAQVQQASSASAAEQDQLGTASRMTMEQDLQLKDHEIAQLLNDLRVARSQQTTIRQSADDQVALMQDQLDEADRRIKELVGDLNKMGDYNELKRELSVFRSIEVGASAGNTTSRGDEDKPLEVLLLEKNRSLESETTHLKVELEKTRSSLVELEAQQMSRGSTLKEQQGMIAQLESELSQLHATQSSDGVPTQNVNEAFLTGTLEEPSNNILPIVTSQRDRFKQRNLELEGEVRHSQTVTKQLRDEIDGLRSDNVKLYEKIKFLQSYPARSNNDNNDVLGRYSDQYEESLSPFQQFNTHERQRKMTNMGVGDRVIYSLGQAILGNKQARYLFLTYALILHLLIFVVLYKYSHVEDCHMNLTERCHQFLAQSAHRDVGHGVHFDSGNLHDTAE